MRQRDAAAAEEKHSADEQKKKAGINTASKLGPHTQTDRGTCPGEGLYVYYKSRYTTWGFERIIARPLRSGP
jgi:hypothetical protein